MLRPAAFAIAAIALADASAGQRTFVASYGMDVDASVECVIAYPCRTFATALTKTTAGGEIIALDAADYGPVVIDRDVSILANPGVHAEIGAPPGYHGVNIQGDYNVVLRGLHIYRAGVPPSPAWANAGVVARASSGSLVMENVTLSGFVSGDTYTSPAGAGLFTEGYTVFIADSNVADNLYGIAVKTGRATIVNTQIFRNTRGVWMSDAHPSVTVWDSVVSHNERGLMVAVAPLLPCGAYCGLRFDGSVRLAITNSTVSHNDTGLRLDGYRRPNTVGLIGYSTFTQNGTGIVVNNASPDPPPKCCVTLLTTGNNIVKLNGVDKPPTAWSPDVGGILFTPPK